MGLFPNDLTEILICPACGGKLEHDVFSLERKDGVFFCKRGHWYPIDGGLPRMLVGRLRGDYSAFVQSYHGRLAAKRLGLYIESSDRAESVQVQQAFGEKWTSKDTMGIDDSSPYKAFMRHWVLQKYGWHDESRFKQAMAEKRLILDAGTGLGREVINFAKSAESATVIGIEFSDCAANALKNVSNVRNAFIIQGDILAMPFRENSFDFIFSEGVLHHTPNPREAFHKCCNVLKNGGEIAFYIYRKKGAAREFTDDYLRTIMQKLSADKQWELADRITQFGKALSNLRADVEIPVDIPELGIGKGRIDVQRLIYWNFLKCFWNDELPFEENRLVNFDWFVPEHAYRFTEDEIRDWCSKEGLETVWFNAQESGFSVRASKRA